MLIGCLLIMDSCLKQRWLQPHGCQNVKDIIRSCQQSRDISSGPEKSEVARVQRFKIPQYLYFCPITVARVSTSTQLRDEVEETAKYMN